MNSRIFQQRAFYKPFDYPWAFKGYQDMQAMHWLPTQAPLHADVDDWASKLTDTERHLLTQLFRFFTQGDVDVASAYRDRYLPLFKHPELSMMLFAFGASEANHVEAYSLLLDTIGMPETEYQAFGQFAEMKSKHDYLFGQRGEGLSETARTALDIAVFSAFSEGMQLFSSFAMLMSFQPRGLMKGMTTIVEWSIRDESHHVEYMTEVFHQIIRENPEIWTDEFKAHIYQTAVEMVELEDHFIDLAFGLGTVEGLTPESVKTYIRYIADRRLNGLGLKSKFGVEANPFEWLDWIMNAQTHTNFFEQRSTEYSQGGLPGWEEAYASPNEETFLVYSKPGCEYCDAAKALLERMDKRRRVMVLESQAERDEFMKRYGTRTWPQVFAVSPEEPARLVGGYEETCVYLSP